ncbi:hypothetical protein H4R20_000397 [Coemansia guatemalensis]|uniref:Uncharacterized protein n=1 Tax=Coemansia guatemalensis TaxID=2761395 RepID=A0A9W8LVH5_9FUNG|nr:hypothetical protein H4R20_000397 [Coemansia guatemalensis]
MHRRTDLSHRPLASPPLSRLMGSIFGSRPASPDVAAPQCPQPALDRWTVAQQHHNTNMHKCKQIDGQLAQLAVELARQAEAAQRLAQELSLVGSVKQQLAAIQAEAKAVQTGLAGLEQTYCMLAGTVEPQWAVELARTEAEHRQARHKHYQQLQQAMDAQYTELSRDSAQMRAASAARSFQRDLDDYRRGHARPRPLRSRDVSGVTAAADAGLARHYDSSMDDFFSDDGAVDVGPQASTQVQNTSSARRPQAPRNNDDDDSSQKQQQPGFTVIEDEDFE